MLMVMMRMRMMMMMMMMMAVVVVHDSGCMMIITNSNGDKSRQLLSQGISFTCPPFLVKWRTYRGIGRRATVMVVVVVVVAITDVHDARGRRT